MSGAARRGRARGASASGLFLFLLLAAFSVLSLLAVLVGAKVYERIDARSAQNYETRTALSYIAGKVRAFDAAGAVETSDADGCPALLLHADYNGTRYTTYIYVYEGSLMEYFARADAAFTPRYGESVAEAEALSVSLQDGLLSVRLTCADGETSSIDLFLQSAEAGA